MVLYLTCKSNLGDITPTKKTKTQAPPLRICGTPPRGGLEPRLGTTTLQFTLLLCEAMNLWDWQRRNILPAPWYRNGEFGHYQPVISFQIIFTFFFFGNNLDKCNNDDLVTPGTSHDICSGPGESGLCRPERLRFLRKSWCWERLWLTNTEFSAIRDGPQAEQKLLKEDITHLRKFPNINTHDFW